MSLTVSHAQIGRGNWTLHRVPPTLTEDLFSRFDELYLRRSAKARFHRDELGGGCGCAEDGQAALRTAPIPSPIELASMDSGLCTKSAISDSASMELAYSSTHIDRGFGPLKVATSPVRRRGLPIVSPQRKVATANANDVRTKNGQQAGWLAPIGLEPSRQKGREKTNGRRASNKGCLPMTLEAYLTLLAWTGRQLHRTKRGQILADNAPIVELWNVAQKRGWTSCRISVSVSATE